MSDTSADPRIAGDLIEVAPDVWVSHLDAVWLSNRQTYLTIGRQTMVSTRAPADIAEAYRRGCELRSAEWRKQRDEDAELEAAEREARGLPDTP